MSVAPARRALSVIGRSIAVALALALPLHAQQPPADSREIELPDIGLSASAAITEQEENAYGAQLLRALRNYNVLIDDPIVTEYLDTLANRLVLSSRRPEQPFRFVVINDPNINAFAVPGGLIAAHSGLILAASQESEFAAVLAHEIAHVTQKHIVRAQERQRLASIPILIGSLAAAVAASRSSGDGAPAAILGGQALMQQFAINFTRDNEFEADRIGIQTLSRAGFDVHAMPRMFGILQRTYRLAPEEEPPAYLRTHPLTTTRISEAAQRAGQLAKPGGTVNSVSYQLVRERVRVLAAKDRGQLFRRYDSLLEDGTAAVEVRYGRALALIRALRYDEAAAELARVEAELPKELIVQLALAELDVARKHEAGWRKRYTELEKNHPDHTVITALHAEALMSLGTPVAGEQAREVLRRLIVAGSDDPEVYERLGRASLLAGRSVRAGEAHVRAAVLRGAYEDALLQLRELARRDDLDYYARARVDAQISMLTPVVMEMRERGIRPQG